MTDQTRAEWWNSALREASRAVHEQLEADGQPPAPSVLMERVLRVVSGLTTMQLYEVAQTVFQSQGLDRVIAPSFAQGGCKTLEKAGRAAQVWIGDFTESSKRPPRAARWVWLRWQGER